MVTVKRSQVVLLIVGSVLLACAANRGSCETADESRRSLAGDGGRKAFDITEFGAQPEAGGEQARKMNELPGGGDPNAPLHKKPRDKMENAKDENGAAITKTWVAACRGEYKGPAKLVVPKGTFITGPVIFQGPCTSSKDIVVEILGELKATTDLSNYPAPEWILFEAIDGLTVNGGGTVNGQGQITYKGKGEDADADDNGKPPSNLKVIKVRNAHFEGITSLNSKYFHFHVTESMNITLDKVTITAPGDSPNTDGCHISDSENVKVINSVIATGDDCVSIGQGNKNIAVNNVTCGPGHGLSIGSLGKYKDEKPVSNVSITNCKLKDTTNGARIKTYAGPNAGEASGIVFDNLEMESVRNPIIIDQLYGEKKNGDKNSGNSPYKLKDIKFKNIKGTATREPIMTFACSGSNPCEGVELENIELTVGGNSAGADKKKEVASGCWHAKITTKGTVKPQAPTCQ